MLPEYILHINGFDKYRISQTWQVDIQGTKNFASVIYAWLHLRLSFNPILQGPPYVLVGMFESLGPTMLTFWIFWIRYVKKWTFQWFIWCRFFFVDEIFIKDIGENLQYHFATLLHTLVTGISIVIETNKKEFKWSGNRPQLNFWC